MTSISNVIWIDEDFENEETKKYRIEIESILYLKVNCFVKVEEAINYLKQIEFVETKIIIGGKFYKEFIDNFIKNLNEINVIPKIAIRKKHIY